MVFPWAHQTGAAELRLRIIALEGDRAVNYLAAGHAIAPVVEVRDENDRPVEGALVVFKAPAGGPGATFDNAQSTLRVISDHRGQAGARGYSANGRPGRFTIEVSASHDNRTGRLLISQTNSAGTFEESYRAKNSAKTAWILAGVVAAAAAATGVYFGTRGSAAPISVETGPVTIGGPRP
jgi:hypothetical protein